VDWRHVPGFENVYAINPLGEIKRIETGKVLKAAIAKNGYYVVSLWKNNKGKTMYIHRMLAEVFIENPNNERTVNHIDGDKTNNDLSNLEWVSYSENNKHAYETGLKVVSENVRNWARQRAIEFNSNRGKLKNGQ
jgi:hypothetical protein